MRLRNTPEMEKLFEKVQPYLNENYELPDDAPEEIKEALEEYRRLGEELWDYAYSL